DVSFRSSDGVLFRTDKWRLEFISDGGFPPMSCNSDEVVELTEESETLKILFTFFYPHLAILDIGALPFDKLSKFFDAADKYAINTAIAISLLHLQKYVKDHPSEILALAGRHNHGPLLAVVAPYVVNVDPEKLKALGFSIKLRAKWVSRISECKSYQTKNVSNHVPTE
ncbi:hypothetical protein C8R42DRAFT_585361, partial [Lentinula raphanica]